MAYQVLARKWRPKTFDEVVGQDHVIRSLKNSVKSNKVAQAILLTGTRGVGKTSIARIFAKAVRCENLNDGNPCLKCASCVEIDSGNSLDYQEFDGASNNGVDNIRDLNENVNFLPTRGEKKIYVIDEIHMLSIGAFNALLKTLEEPPAHVIFIFATTDPQKIPPTVLSRCLRFDLKNVTQEKIEERLKFIGKAEGIKFESDEVVRKIAQFGNGSMRDTLSLMDQVLNYSLNNQVGENEIVAAIGLARSENINQIILAMLSGDLATLNTHFQECLKEGVDLKVLSEQLSDKIFWIIQNSADEGKVAKELKAQIEMVKDVSQPELYWIFEAFNKDVDWALKSLDPSAALQIILQKTTLRRTFLAQDHLGAKKKINETTGTVETVPTPVKVIKDWSGFIKSLYEKHPTVAANIEHGNLLEPISMQGNALFIKVGFAIEQDMFFQGLKQPKTYQNFLAALADYFDVKPEALQVDIRMVGREGGFVSRIEQEQKEKMENEELKKQNLLNNPFVQEAEKLFNTKVSKVILNK